MIDKKLTYKTSGMYQSSFAFLSFLVLVILVVYQDMTRQYLLRTTIRTKIQLFTLMESKVYNNTKTEYLNYKTQNDSTDSNLYRQNNTTDEPTVTGSLLLGKEREEGNLNYDISSYLNRPKNKTVRINLYFTKASDTNHKENIKIKLNRSILNDDTDLTTGRYLFERNNNKASKDTSENKNNLMGKDALGKRTMADILKPTAYGRHKYSISKTYTGRSHNSSDESGCQKFIYDNLNNYLNNAVFESLKRKCSGKKVKRIPFRLDKSLLSKNIQNVQCPTSKMEYLTTKAPLVALASFPGSGNTWTRVLLERVTGIHTGSLYKDPKSNFQGSKVCPTNGDVFIVKTHKASDLAVRNNCKSSRFSRAIFILRNPYDAIMAEFNRLNNGKVGFASKREFHSTRWRAFAMRISNRWMKTTLYWLTKYKMPLHVIIYERLQANTILEMYKVMNFLNRGISLKTLYCLGNKPQNKYYRGTKPEWMIKTKLFGEKAIDHINRSIRFIGQRISHISVKQTIQSYLLPVYAL